MSERSPDPASKPFQGPPTAFGLDDDYTERRSLGDALGGSLNMHPHGGVDPLDGDGIAPLQHGSFDSQSRSLQSHDTDFLPRTPWPRTLGDDETLFEGAEGTGGHPRCTITALDCRLRGIPSVGQGTGPMTSTTDESTSASPDIDALRLALSAADVSNASCFFSCRA